MIDALFGLALVPIDGFIIGMPVVMIALAIWNGRYH
jgi:hypothetical protein